MAFNKTIKQLIEGFLIHHPVVRDDDNKLISFVWLNEAGGSIKLQNTTAYDFLTLLRDGKLTNPETIRRIRQKLQETNASLRGDKYNERKANEKKIIHDLKNFNNGNSNTN